MKSSQVVAAIVAGLDVARFVAFPELRCGNLGRPGGQESQRIDLWTIDTFDSGHYARDAYEVKCSRADYASEVRNPSKRTLAMLLSNRYWFAVPAGLVRADEVPLDCGLVWVHPDGRVEQKLPAPWREVPPPTVRFLAELARRSVDPATTGFRGVVAAVERARAELRWAEEEKASARRERDRLAQQADRLRAEIAVLRARRDEGHEGAT